MDSCHFVDQESFPQGLVKREVCQLVSSLTHATNLILFYLKNKIVEHRES